MQVGVAVREETPRADVSTWERFGRGVLRTPYGVEGMGGRLYNYSLWNAWRRGGDGDSGCATIRYGTPGGVETMWTSSVQLFVMERLAA